MEMNNDKGEKPPQTHQQDQPLARQLSYDEKKKFNGYIEHDNVDEVSRWLDSGVSLDQGECSYISGYQPLHVASYYNSLKVAELLLSRGANMNAKVKSNGDTSLMVACRGGHSDVARVLIEGGSNINAKNNNGDTPLMLACWKGHIEIATILIERGSDIDAKNDYGGTSLMLACQNEDAEVARMLIKEGASGKTPTNLSNIDTPLHHLCQWEDSWEPEAKILIEGGSDINAKNKHGDTPLMVACRWKGNADIARILIEGGSDINAKNKHGDTPLMIACRNGQINVAEVILIEIEKKRPDKFIQSLEDAVEELEKHSSADDVHKMKEKLLSIRSLAPSFNLNIPGLLLPSSPPLFSSLVSC